MKEQKIIRTSTCSLKFANDCKKKQLKELIQQFRDAVEQFIDLFWEMEKIQSLPRMELLSKIDSKLSARMLQCAGKQASGIVRGTRQKQKQRLFKIKEFQKEGKDSSKIQRAFDKAKVSKPKIKSLEAQLSERTATFAFDNSTSFDGWITLTALGGARGATLVLPFKKSKHFNRLASQGQIAKSIRISEKSVSFVFELPKPEITKGQTIGIDIGATDLFVLSDGQFAPSDAHGWNISKIADRLSRKKKGSKGFKKAQAHRNDFINWSIKQLNLSNVGQINIENIRHLRRNKRSSRKLSHWIYPAIFGKIESVCEEAGVLVSHRNPMFTSQRCSECGWTQKSNRSGKVFHCKNCDFTIDADWNASRNLAIDLPKKTWEDWQRKENRRGFFWNPVGQEPMVPAVQESQEYLECF